MVCDHSYFVSLTQTAYMCGYVLAGCFKFLSDKFGRRKMMLYAFTIEAIGCLSCAFSVNIYQYMISRFIQSFGGCLGELEVLGKLKFRILISKLIF